MDKVQQIKDYIENLKHEGTNPYDRRTFELLCEIDSYINSLQEEPVSNMWHKYSKYDKPFTDRGIVVHKNNKLYYGKYTSGAYNFVFVQINIKDVTAQSCLIYDTLTNGDEWVYFEDTLKLSNVQRITKNWKEPVSEDLEEEIIRYIGFPQEVDEDVSTTMIRKAAHHFANWQKEQFEKNRLAACDAQTKEEAEREMDFVEKIIMEEHRQPTYSDAIEYGMKKMKEQMMKDSIDAVIHPYDGEIWTDKKDLEKYDECQKVKVIIMKEEEEW